MSRLYVKTAVDGKWNTASTKRAQRRAVFQALWGSKTDSKLAVEVEVEWEDGDRPTVYVNGEPVALMKSSTEPFDRVRDFGLEEE